MPVGVFFDPQSKIFLVCEDAARYRGYNKDIEFLEGLKRIARRHVQHLKIVFPPLSYTNYQKTESIPHIVLEACLYLNVRRIVVRYKL
jgi:hypothetical protein